MKSIDVRINWFYVLPVLLVVLVGMSFVGWMVSRPALLAIFTGQHMIDVRTLWGVVAVDVALLFAYILLVLKVLLDLNMTVDSEGIWRATLTGPKKMNWVDVSRIEKVGFRIHVHGQGSEIVLTPHAYRGADTMMENLASHLEKSRAQ